MSASSSGTSPEVTTTMPAKSSGSADRPQPTAWPVPSCCSCTAMSIVRPRASASSATAGAMRSRSWPSTTTRCCGRHLGDRVQRVRQHAAAGQRVQHLRGVRPHPGAGPGRQHQDRGIAMHGHSPVLARELACRGRSRQPISARSASFAQLRRQDSNLNYLNQNQRCCRLHHDGLIKPVMLVGSATRLTGRGSTRKERACTPRAG